MLSFLGMTVASLCGLIAGVVASLCAPWVQAAVESRRTRDNARRELLAQSRRLLATRGSAYFVTTPTYSRVRPFLQASLVSEIESGVVTVVAGGGPRTESPKQTALLDELARIEREWNLL